MYNERKRVQEQNSAEERESNDKSDIDWKDRIESEKRR